MVSFTPQEIEQFLQEFFDVVGTRQYIGARYVPLFGRKGEESIDWDDSAPYEPLTVVLWQGDSYTSRQYVPAGVSIDNADYWARTGNFNSQVEEYKRIVEGFADAITQTSADVESIKEILPFSGFSPTITVKNYIDNLMSGLRQVYTPLPVSPESTYGTAGQILSTLANGYTKWINPISPTDEQAAEAIDAWLTAHPEATTTIQDGAVTTAKLADGAVTDDKLASNGAKALAEMVPSILKVLKEYETAIQGGTWQVRFNIADLPTYYTGGYVDADGTINTTGQHNIKLLPLLGVDAVGGVGTSTAPGLAGFVYEKADGTFVSRNLASRYILIAWGGGAPVSYMLINHFDANVANPRDFINEIDVHLCSGEIGLEYAGNMLDPNRLFTYFPSCMSYSDGGIITSPLNTYFEYIVPAEAGVTYYRSNNPAHVVFLDEDGNYMSGLLSPTIIAPPAGCRTIGLGIKTDPQWLSKGDPLPQYEDPYLITRDIPRYGTWSQNDIHFTVPITDTPTENVSANGSTSVDQYHVNDVNCVLHLPTSYRREGDPTPLVVIIHGSGYGVSSTAWGGESGGVISELYDFRKLINAFVNAGFAVCDCNGYDNTTALRIMGCPRGVYAYRKMIDRVMLDYNVQRSVSVYGFSMGGIGAINFALANRDIVKAVALGSPLVALFQQGYSRSATWKTYLASAYDFTVPSGFEFADGEPTSEEMLIWNNNVDKVKNYDAYANAESGKMHLLPPIRIWHGTDDTATEYAMSSAFVTALRDDCNVPVTLRTVTGAGHEICWGQNSAINAEYRDWFRRFD